MVEAWPPRSVSECEVGARITSPERAYEVWFKGGSPLKPATESWASVALLLAMRRGSALRCHAEVSARWLANQSRVQQVLVNWYPSLRVVPVQAEGVVRHSAPTGKTAAFFSGGVDSFSTTLRNADALSAVIAVHGFDVTLDRNEFWRTTVARLSSAAAELGIPLRTVVSNVRQCLDDAGDWVLLTHGAGLASVALLHQAQFDRVLIPSSHTFNDLFPWGSHPLTDPLWGSETLELVHEGAHLTRFEKTKQVARSATALRHLRVCNHQIGSSYNCGECEKCIRTQCALVLSGASDTLTFPRPVTPAIVRRVYLHDENAASFVRDTINGADANHPLIEALQETLWRYEARQCRVRFGNVWAGLTPGRFRRWVGERFATATQ